MPLTTSACQQRHKIFYRTVSRSHAYDRHGHMSPTTCWPARLAASGSFHCGCTNMLAHHGRCTRSFAACIVCCCVHLPQCCTPFPAHSNRASPCSPQPFTNTRTYTPQQLSPPCFKHATPHNTFFSRHRSPASIACQPLTSMAHHPTSPGTIHAHYHLTTSTTHTHVCTNLLPSNSSSTASQAQAVNTGQKCTRRTVDHAYASGNKQQQLGMLPCANPMRQQGTYYVVQVSCRHTRITTL